MSCNEISHNLEQILRGLRFREKSLGVKQKEKRKGNLIQNEKQNEFDDFN